MPDRAYILFILLNVLLYFCLSFAFQWGFFIFGNEDVFFGINVVSTLLDVLLYFCFWSMYCFHVVLNWLYPARGNILNNGYSYNLAWFCILRKENSFTREKEIENHFNKGWEYEIMKISIFFFYLLLMRMSSIYNHCTINKISEQLIINVWTC